MPSKKSSWLGNFTRYPTGANDESALTDDVGRAYSRKTAEGDTVLENKMGAMRATEWLHTAKAVGDYGSRTVPGIPPETNITYAGCEMNSSVCPDSANDSKTELTLFIAGSPLSFLDVTTSAYEEG